MPLDKKIHWCFRFRRYGYFREAKMLSNTSNLDSVTIIFLQTGNSQLHGKSTAPWSKDVYSIQGGVIIKAQRVDSVANLVHELGHSLGLLHTHEGQPSQQQFAYQRHSCLELQPNVETGDLCSDTPPTPVGPYAFKACNRPNWNHEDACSRLRCPTMLRLQIIPQNYMSYTPLGWHSCRRFFTSQQTGRMHCYLDFLLRRWVTNRAIAPLPAPPSLWRATSSEAAFGWPAPLDDLPVCADLSCSHCDANTGSLIQFAYKAASLHSPSNGTFSSTQALGMDVWVR